MKKKDLVNSLKQYANGGAMITRGGIAHFLGLKNPANADKYINGLQGISGKYYYIPDVADNMLAHTETRRGGF